jgi:hypothetical protein
LNQPPREGLGSQEPTVPPAQGGGEQRVVGYRILDDRPVAARDAEQKARMIARRRGLVDRVYQLVDYAFILLYGLLAIRLLLGLVNASPAAGFVRFINALTQPFYAPFVGIVASVDLSPGQLELPIVICVLAYLLLHVAVRGLLRVVLGTKRSI